MTRCTLLWLVGCANLLFASPTWAADPPAFETLLRQRISADDRAWLKQATQRQLDGCRVRSDDGRWMYTPDGVGNYRALWTRDFAYMVHYAGDLLPPAAIKASIAYLLRGQRADGCMPDRVTVDGRGVYSPGPEQSPMADHALDNGPFLATLAVDYWVLSSDADYFREIEPALRRGLDHTRRAENGLVFNPPAAPQCPYGFTDTVAKTGHLLCCSVLYYDACCGMERACRATGCGEPAEYARRAQLIREHIGLLWDDASGMFWAADRDCRQIDIWGSALAVELGCTTDQQADRIATYLATHYDGIVQRGQVRHLPAGETWQRLLMPIAPGKYQNGAFWGTPVPWVARTLARRDPALAVRLVGDVIQDYRQRGIMECVNADYHAVPEYVVSATNVYALVK